MYRNYLPNSFYSIIGSTALVYAAKAGFTDIVQLLLSCPQWPAGPQAGCTLGVTAREALVAAAKEGHLDVLEVNFSNQPRTCVKDF